MGNSKSHAGHQETGSDRKHPLLSNLEYDHAVKVLQKVDGAALGKGLCQVLGVPETDAQVLDMMFETVSKATGKEKGKEFADVVALVARGTTSDIRRAAFKAVKDPVTDLVRLFAFLFHAAGNGGDSSDFSMLEKGLVEFSERQAKIDGADKVVIHFGMFNRWCSAYIPSIQDPLSGLFRARILTENGANPCTMGHVTEELTESVKESEVLDKVSLFSLRCCDARFQGKWDRLFSSSKDGMSFDSMIKSLIGYPGPTFIAIKDASNARFGALVTEPWKEHGVFYGQPNSLLIGLSPEFVIRRCRGDGSAPNSGNFQYLKARGKTGHQGIGLGGDENHLRFWLDRNLEACHAGDSGLTYELGSIRGKDQASESFQPIVIETWGLGGEEAMASLQEHQTGTEQLKQNMRAVDRKKFADNSFDREFLLGKTFQHQAQASEREGR